MMILLLHLEKFITSFKIFDEAIREQATLKVLDVLLRTLLQKSFVKFMIWCRATEDEWHEIASAVEKVIPEYCEEIR